MTSTQNPGRIDRCPDCQSIGIRKDDEILYNGATGKPHRCPSACPGTGTLAEYQPAAQRLTCSICGTLAPVESDGKRTWFKEHPQTP